MEEILPKHLESHELLQGRALGGASFSASTSWALSEGLTYGVDTGRCRDWPPKESLHRLSRSNGGGWGEFT